MPSLYTFTIPTLLKPLRNARAYIAYAASYAKDNNVDPKDYINARLAPDMQPFSFQIYWMTENATVSAAHASGNEVKLQPSWSAELDLSFDDLLARIDGTIKVLEGYKEADFEGREGKEVVFQIKAANLEVRFADSEDYLSAWGLPNFFFHQVTAYDILRHKGVDLGKAKYLNAAGEVNFKPVE